MLNNGFLFILVSRNENSGELELSSLLGLLTDSILIDNIMPFGFSINDHQIFNFKLNKTNLNIWTIYFAIIFSNFKNNTVILINELNFKGLFKWAREIWGEGSIVSFGSLVDVDLSIGVRDLANLLCFISLLDLFLDLLQSLLLLLLLGPLLQISVLDHYVWVIELLKVLVLLIEGGLVDSHFQQPLFILQDI